MCAQLHLGGAYGLLVVSRTGLARRGQAICRLSRPTIEMFASNVSGNGDRDGHGHEECEKIQRPIQRLRRSGRCSVLEILSSLIDIISSPSLCLSLLVLRQSRLSSDNTVRPFLSRSPSLLLCNQSVCRCNCFRKPCPPSLLPPPSASFLHCQSSLMVNANHWLLTALTRVSS